MTFRANDEFYDLKHDIVCWNDLIFCKSVRLGMANNVAEKSFHLFRTKKIFFIFWVPKMGFFAKKLQNLCFKIGPHHLIKILDHIWCTNNQMVACQKLSLHLFSKRQNAGDSAGSGSNLNCSCFIVFLLFLLKIIFWFTIGHLIRDTLIVWQNSTRS